MVFFSAFFSVSSCCRWKLDREFFFIFEPKRINKQLCTLIEQIWLYPFRRWDEILTRFLCGLFHSTPFAECGIFNANTVHQTNWFHWIFTQSTERFLFRWERNIDLTFQSQQLPKHSTFKVRKKYTEVNIVRLSRTTVDAEPFPQVP